MSQAVAGRWRTVCLGSAGAFLALGSAAVGYGILPGESSLRAAIVAQATPGIAEATAWVNHAGAWPVLLPGMLILLALSREARRRWWLWCGVLLLGGMLEEVGKQLVARPRPEGTAFGFPSGHATAAATFSTLVVYILSRTGLAPPRRLPLYVLAVFPMVSVGLARIILGAHWPADVAGGLALGVACTAAGAWWDAAHPPSSMQPIAPAARRCGSLAPPRKVPTADERDGVRSVHG